MSAGEERMEMGVDGEGEQPNSLPSPTEEAVTAPGPGRKNGAKPLIQIRGFRKQYPGVLAVDGVELDLYPGEVVGLVGKNGAGKSTLIKMLAGAVVPDEGELSVDGQATKIESPHHASMLGLSFVHQEAVHASNLSVAENVELGLGYPRRLGLFVDWRALQKKTREVLGRLDADIDPKAQVRELSIVQQRLVMIARGLAAEMRLLVLDEPTASLTDEEIRDLHQVVRSLAAQGVSVVYISHRLDEVFEITDRVVVMRDGRVVADAPKKELTPPELIAQITGHEELGASEEVGLGVERVISVERPKSPREQELLRVEDISLPGVVEDVSFSLRAGEILGIAGLIGSGRTELVRLIFGADRRAGGRILVHGEEARISGPTDALQAGIVLLPEDRRSQGTVLDFSIRKNVTLATLPKHRLVSLLPVPATRSERKTARRLMQRLRISAPGEERPVKLLSGGNQQKVVLAKWLERGADVLIFDEPTHGIDVEGKEEIYRLMVELAEGGKGVIFISSEFPELVPLCHRVIVLSDGRIVATLEGEQISEASILEHCYAGEREAPS